MAKLNLVGIGPSSEDYVTPAAKKIVQHAQLVISAQRSLKLFPNELKGQSIILRAESLIGALKQVAESLKANKNVALLSTGDPGFSGLLHTVLKSGLFNASDLNVVPGIIAIQACAARLLISWDRTRLFTFHDQILDDQKEKLLQPNLKNFKPKDVATFLINLGTDKETSVSICENITLENEKITQSTIEKFSMMTFGSSCVMVIQRNTVETNE